MTSKKTRRPECVMCGRALRQLCDEELGGGGPEETADGLLGERAFSRRTWTRIQAQLKARHRAPEGGGLDS